MALDGRDFIFDSCLPDPMKVSVGDPRSLYIDVERTLLNAPDILYVAAYLPRDREAILKEPRRYCRA